MQRRLLFFLLLLSFLAQAQNKKGKRIPTNPANTYEFSPTINAPSVSKKQQLNNAEASLLAQFKPLNAPVHIGLNDTKVIKDNDGEIIMIQGSKLTANERTASTQQRINAYLTSIGTHIGFRQMNEQFTLQRTDVDDLGMEHHRMQQVFQNIPVYGSEIILHGRDGNINLLNGRFYPTPNLADVVPTVSEASATAIITNDLKSKGYELVSSPLVKQQFEAALVIYHKNHDKKMPFLAWHITARPNAMTRFEYFVDAKKGEVIHSFNHTCNFVGHYHSAACNEAPAQQNSEMLLDGSADAAAKDLFGISRNLKTYLSSSKYYMIDASRTMYNAGQSNIPNDPVGAIWTLDAFNTSPENSSFKYDHVTSSDNKWSNAAGAVSAHYNAGLAYDYYKNIHKRESINGKGGTIISLVNVTEKNGASMANAFWSGEAMFYGNGGSEFYPLAKGLDVAGHEMSHGVVQSTANLEYQNESGAMNESFADIFGAMIDRDDWKIGEDVVKLSVFPSGALRDLSNPNNGGTSLNDNGWQPKHVNEQYKGSQDNGGVHINSGITNFAFYKYATAIGKDKAEKVFYRALEKYLVKSSKFIDLRAAAQQAANDLYGSGSNESNQIATAFSAVGIGSGGSSTGGGYQTDVKTNPGSDIILYTDNDYSTISLYFPATKTSKKISDTDLNSRPSVTDDGSYMVFVADDKTMHGIAFDWAKGEAKEEILSSDKVWNNAVISKDGNLVAATLNQKDNRIIVYDFTKSPVASKTFTLTNPTYTSGISTGDVQYSDAMEFDITSSYIMYDAYNKLNGTSGAIDYWDIGFINVYDQKAKSFGNGKIEKLFSDLPEQTSVGNPNFSKNSPYIVAFDYIENFDNDKTYLLTANIQTGDVGEIFYNGEGVWSYPSFSRLDDKVLFETEDAIGNYAGALPLSSNKLSTNAKQPDEVVDLARWPLWFSNGTRVLVGTNEVAQEVFKIYPNPFNDVLNVTFMNNTGAQEEKSYNVIDITGKVVMTGTTTNSALNLNVGQLTAGTYFFKVGTAVQKVIKF